MQKIFKFTIGIYHRIYYNTVTVNNMRPLLKEGTVFESSHDIENFRRVYIDEQHSIAWDIDPSIDSNKVRNNTADLCPDSCYIDSVPLGSIQSS